MTICNQMDLGLAQENINGKTWFSRFFTNLSKRYKIKREQRMNRAAFSNLLHLEDEILRDMGILRGDVEWAAQLPLTCNAGAELEAMKKARKLAANESLAVKREMAKSRIKGEVAKSRLKGHGFYYL